MPTEPWRYAVIILRDDRSAVGQIPVVTDWEPFREWLRFTALRQGMPTNEALALDVCMEPVWHRERGEPFIDGIRTRARGVALSEESVILPTDFFASHAQSAIGQLVEKGALAEGETVRYVPMAFAAGTDASAVERPARFKAQARTPALAIAEDSLDDLVRRSENGAGAFDDTADDVPVFVPQSVLDELRAATARVHGVFEIGGLLIGHLARDAQAGDLLVRVTAQIPARHIETDSTHLTFTSETWTAFRSALDLRARDEIMLGYWHSHPVREWCKSCPEEKQRACVFRGDFFSVQDRLLHRAMFPRAYTVALVVNDVSYDEPTISMFGWRRGAIESRAFRILDPQPVVTTEPVLAGGGFHA